MKTLVYSGPADALPLVERLVGHAFSVHFAAPEPGALLPLFQNCDVFLDASMKVPIGRDAISANPNLSLVVTATTGADHIDGAALADRGIPLLTLRGQYEVLNGLTGAAEHSWLLLMACARHFCAANMSVQQGRWDRVDFPGRMLRGKVIGIVGLGRIGRWMARYATAFDMRVVAADPGVESGWPPIEILDLDSLLPIADFVTVHVNLTDDTRNLLNAGRIAQMKNGAVLINTSRADIVDEDAVVEALREGRLAAVGLDVLRGEPHIEQSPLWRYSQNVSNVVITPHIGGFCPEAVEKVIEHSCQRILVHFDLNKAETK